MIKALYQAKLPYKPIVDLAFHYTAPPTAVTSSNFRPAIINIHGVFGSHKLFRPLDKPLAENLNADVYDVDLRDHGNSPFAHPFNFVTFAKDVIHFIKKHVGERRPVQLVGFSIGGKIALLTALCSQINVTKCVSIDLPPYETPHMDPVITQNFNLIDKIENREIKIEKGSKGWRNKLLSLFQKLPANVGNKGDPSLYFANGFLGDKVNSRPPKSDKEDPYIEFYLPLHEFPNILQEIKKWPDLFGMDNADGMFKFSTDAPTLFLRGMHSEFIKDDYSLLKKSFPNAIVKEFDTGHILPVEKPKESLKCIIDFLKKRD